MRCRRDITASTSVYYHICTYGPPVPSIAVMTTATTTPQSSTVQVRFKRAHNDAIRRRDNEHARHEHRLEVSVRCDTSDADRSGSCHHCKSAVPAESLLHCTTRRSLTSRDCRKKYCRACVERHYGGLPRAQDGRHWTCPACSGLCMCPACKRKLSTNAADAPPSCLRRAGSQAASACIIHHCQTNDHQHQHQHHHTSRARDGAVSTKYGGRRGWYRRIESIDRGIVV